MPHLNHTGPGNEGPKTGRKLGKCTNTEGKQTSEKDKENAALTVEKVKEND